MNSIKNDVKTIIENQKLVIAEILGMKTRIDALERQDVNKNIAIDVIVADLLNQKRIIQNKLYQVDTSINDLNEKLCEIEETKRIKPKNADHEQSVKMCKFDKSGFCREIENCQFSHGLKVCEEFLISSECTKQKCYERHPKICIYFARGECHWGLRCKYLHQANKEIVETDDKVSEDSEHNIECLNDNEESIESIMAKAKAFKFDEEDDNYDESLESIMAKAKAFETDDEEENC